ncbi:MAG: O-antigen ligase family protein [Candidatus Izemoplasmatales bacterium]|nr:O-antigen ligase family protein [Candidatus Izemoplasmatales bacterium]MDD5292800.1 O-antigen ligase family protein [Candidatus Izemoplasmatales bacterium]
MKRFLLSTWYLLIISLATLGFWALGLESIGIPLFLAGMLLVFIFMRSVMPSIPLLLNALFMISQTEWDMQSIPVFLYAAPIVIIIGFIIHVIRFRVNIFKGKMLLGIALMFLAMLLSSMNAAKIDLNYIFYAAIGLVYALVYLFYVNTLEGDYRDYLLKMLLLLGFLISAEILIYYLRVEDFAADIENKRINLGWGFSNYIATYLIVFIPAAFYYAKKSRVPIIYLGIAAFQIIMLLFTASRGGIVAFIPIFPALIVYLLKGPHWRRILLSGVAILGAIAVIVTVFTDPFQALFSRLLVMQLDDSGRFAIWQDALNMFYRHPLFGGGIFARVDDLGGYRMYHNTFLHVLATFGAFGLVTLIIQLVQMFRVILKSINPMSLILAISVLGAQLHGMIDNIYFMPQFMVLFFIIIAVMENANASHVKLNTSENGGSDFDASPSTSR